MERWPRLAVVSLVSGCVTFLVLRQGTASSRDVVNVVALGAVVAAVALAATFVLLAWILPLASRRRSLRATVAAGPLAHEGLGSDHQAIRSAIDAMERRGYTVTVAGHSGTVPTVLMVHADGSVGVVQAVGPAARAFVQVSSCLVPGDQWLVTHGGPSSSIFPHVILETVPGWAEVGVVVEAHRRVLVTLAAGGVSAVPVSPDDAATDRLARMNVSLLLAMWSPSLRARARRRRHVVDHPGWEAKVAELRRIQGLRGIRPTG